MIVCTCRELHREHEFTAGLWGLCSVCGHTVSAHKSDARRNADIADRITRLLHVMTIEDWQIHTDGEGRVHIAMDLR